jgi:hypothetical protein
MSLPRYKVSESMMKRYTRAKGEQSKGSACIICGKNFDDCPHSFVDIDKISMAIDVALMLGIKP